MKNSMKLSVLAIMVMLVSTTFAQTFGVKAGLNLSNMTSKDNNGTYSDDFKSNVGFHIGPTLEIPFGDVVSFETGLLLSTKGYKVEESFDGESYKGKVNLMYLDIPLTAKASFDIGGPKIYGTFGPYVGVGISGKFKFDGEDDEKVKFGSGDEDDLKRLDYGLTIGTGVEFDALQVGLSYGLGLANVASYTEGGNSSKNRVLSLSVGYKFGK